jgi:hypothetical protein
MHRLAPSRRGNTQLRRIITARSIAPSQPGTENLVVEAFFTPGIARKGRAADERCPGPDALAHENKARSVVDSAPTRRGAAALACNSIPSREMAAPRAPEEPMAHCRASSGGRDRAHGVERASGGAAPPEGPRAETLVGFARRTAPNPRGRRHSRLALRKARTIRLTAPQGPPVAESNAFRAPVSSHAPSDRSKLQGHYGHREEAVRRIRDRLAYTGPMGAAMIKSPSAALRRIKHRSG